jgi:hypothetical protein
MFGRRIVLGIGKRTPALPREVIPRVKQSPVRPTAYRVSRVPVGHFDRSTSLVGSATQALSRVAPLESIAGYQPSAVLSSSTPSRIGASITAPRENPPLLCGSCPKPVGGAGRIRAYQNLRGIRVVRVDAND